MPRGSGRWSRAGHRTGRFFVVGQHPPDPASIAIARIEKETSVSMQTVPPTLESDMKKVVKRAIKLGLEIKPLNHGGASILIPGNNLYVPKKAAHGTLKTLNAELDRYEESLSSPAPTTATPTPKEAHMASTKFDFNKLAEAWYAKEEVITKLSEENKTLHEMVTELEDKIDDLTAKLNTAKEHQLSEDDRALLQAAKAFRSVAKGDN